MNQVRLFLARIRGFFSGHSTDGEALEEMRAHLAMETEENIRRGMDPETARRQALLSAGGVTQAVEAVHDQKSLPWAESFAADIRYAIRALRHNLSFSIVVVLTLALGIGANTAIFSVVRGVLLKPLPHREGERLVYLRLSSDIAGATSMQWSVPEVRDLRQGTPALAAGVAEYSPWNSVMYVGETASRLQLGLVTGNYFEVMGLKPILGRVTRPSDDGPGVEPVMILTHEFWQRRFRGDSSVVNTQVRINGRAATIIGVLEPAPFFPTRMDVLMNMVISPHHIGAGMQEVRTHRMTEVVARLAQGAALTQAQAQVSQVLERAKQDHPGDYDVATHPRVAVTPFREAIGEQASLTLYLLMGAAAFVMIIAVANVANLTLMRGVRREQELVVRASLGAGVARLRRLLMAENLVLALVGAAGGVGIAVAGVPLLVGLANRYSPRANEIHLDGAVLAFTLFLALGTALLFSLVAPLPGENTLAAVATGGRRASGGLRRQRLQRALVVVQVAVSVVLLAGAGLLTRTMLRLSDVPTGLQTEEILTMNVNLLAAAGQNPDSSLLGDAQVRFGQMREEIAALPGVVAVGFGATPLSTQGYMEMDVEGKPLASGQPAYRAEWRGGSLDYFKASGMSLLDGRLFTTADEAPGQKVVVANKLLADQFFPGENPIGKRFAISGIALRLGMVKKEDWLTIVGVIGNTQDGGLDAKPRPAFYMPLSQDAATGGSLVIRTDRDAASQANAARSIILRIAPQALIERVLTIRQIKDLSVAPRRLNAILVSSFGLLAVLIAAVGIAGVLAFSVSARTQEIGIRMSLGAASSSVLRMILREGGALLLAGLGIGLVVSIAAGGAIRGLLFGVDSKDPVTLLAVSAVMAVIGLVACWIPAVRASRVDPAITMRS